MTTIIFLIILMTLTVLKLLIQGIYLIHRLQLLGYYNLKFIKWLEGKQYREILLWNIFELLFPLLIIYIFYWAIKQLPIYKYITSTIMISTFTWKIIHPFIAGWVGPKAKKNIKVILKYTPRIIRLFLSLIFVSVISIIFIFYYTAIPLKDFTLSSRKFFQFNAFLLFTSVITPVIVLIANLINMPIEKLIHLKYFNMAKNKSKKADIIKIAITGSYGKTSTKFFLASIIKEKYKTLFTPASYNTPMGISKVINNNNLNDYEVFVVEMGADHKGDINKLCKLIKPDYGIITAIDNQHLETFGNLENIIITKLSLFKHINKDGFGIYNYDNKILKKNIKNNNFHIPIYSYSIVENNFNNVDIIAGNIKHTRDGLQFTAILKDGESIEIKTEVLGKHNASNLLASILMCKVIGISSDEILRGIKNIKPVEHRLQKIDAGTGILVLDDAFNSNPAGAHEALQVLNEIEGNKKVIVTPGMVELGEKEEEINRTFGNQIAQYVDIAILVGKDRTYDIYEGIVENGFNKENIITVNSLNEAKDALARVLVKGDVVLFENDLPDTYNE